MFLTEEWKRGSQVMQQGKDEMFKVAYKVARWRIPGLGGRFSSGIPWLPFLLSSALWRVALQVAFAGELL